MCVVNENTCGYDATFAADGGDNNSIPNQDDRDDRDCYCPLNHDWTYLGESYEQRHRICVSNCMPN